MRANRALLLNLFALLASLALPPGLAAQRLAPASSPFARAPVPHALDFRAPTSATRVPRDDINEPVLVIGGLLGGAAGLVGGAVAGHRFDTPPCEDCIESAIAGAIIGEAIGAPLGVHIANHGRGDLGLSIAASLGIGFAGWMAAAKWSAPFIIAVPIAQIGAAIGVAHAGRREPAASGQ